MSSVLSQGRGNTYVKQRTRFVPHQKEQTRILLQSSSDSKTVDTGQKCHCKSRNNHIYISVILLSCETITTNCHIRPRPAVWWSSQLHDTTPDPHPPPPGIERTTPAWWTCIDRPAASPRDGLPFLHETRWRGIPEVIREDYSSHNKHKQYWTRSRATSDHNQIE